MTPIVTVVGEASRSILSLARLGGIALDIVMQPRRGRDRGASNDCAAEQSATNAELLPERLYKITRAAVRRYMGSRFGGRDDLVQEAVERVLRGLCDGRFSGDCALSTWVTAIAQNVAMEEFRAVARSTARGGLSAELVEAVTPIDFEHQLEARSTLARVQRLLSTMDSATVNIIVLHDLLGYELAEVAVLTHLSTAAAQSRLVRARKTLQRKLKGELIP